MEPTNDNNQSRESLDERLLDRLVDGELGDCERRELLQQLENQPGGWRRCALAFLEAQTWSEALASAAGPECVARPESASVVSYDPGHRGVDTPRSPIVARSRFWRPVAPFTGLAAGLALAFVLGWSYRGGLVGIGPSADANRQTGSVVDRSVGATVEAAVKVAAEHSTPTKPAVTAGSVDPIVKNLQQRGYSVETQQRLVSMESKDGRKVKLPVQEVRIRYTGGRIY
jgi:hypothetical protein